MSGPETVLGTQSSVPLSGVQEEQTMSPGACFTPTDTGGPLGITYVAGKCSDLAAGSDVSWCLSLSH